MFSAFRRVAGTMLSWTLIAVLSAIAITCVVIPYAPGFKGIVLETGSMSEGGLPPGTFVVVQEADADEIGVGDVVTFHPRSGDPTMVTHRVVGTGVAADGEARFVTQGDSNGFRDAALVQPAQLVGRAVYALPGYGFIVALHPLVKLSLGAGLVGGAILASALRRRSREWASERHARHAEDVTVVAGSSDTVHGVDDLDALITGGANRG